MTLLEIGEVQPGITEVDITARDENTRYLHRWIIGKDASDAAPKIWRDIQEGKLTLIREAVNIRGQKGRGGQSVVESAFKPDAIPKELLKAPVTHLFMNSRNGVDVKVWVDVEINEPPLFREEPQ